jgi:transcriptional regulator with XRE-family HTH domain
MKKKSELKPEVAFGHVIRELRNQQNISQEKLALISDMDRTFISLLERGLRQPSLKSILRLSESLRIRPGDLIERVVEKLPQKTKATYETY